LIFQHSVSDADKLVHGRRDDLHFLFATLCQARGKFFELGLCLVAEQFSLFSN